MLKPNYESILARYGQQGVEALVAATPIDSGETASNWTYEIKKAKGKISVGWYNNHREGGVPVVVLIQYGHATGNGGFVQGRDFINPALQPIFDDIANKIWAEVTTK